MASTTLLHSSPARTMTSMRASTSARSPVSASLRQSRSLGTQLASSSFTGVRLVPKSASLSVKARGALQVEANLFSRISRIFKSYANSVVSSAEDPEKILEQAVTEMQEDLIRMRQASAQVMASQKQMENKYKQAKQTSDDWYRRAELALQKGDEELAKEALKRRKAYLENSQQLESQLAAQKQATDTLVGNTRILENKLAEAKSKKDTLKARAISAKTSKQVSEMVGSLTTGKNAVSAFERMEEKVMAMEAESEATLQMISNDGLEDKFAALEGSSVDDELSAMKRGMLSGGRSSTKAELPAGRPIRDAIDFELEELRRKARD